MDRPINPVFEKPTGNCLDETISLSKQYSKKEHSSNKLTPIQVSLKNEGHVYQTSLDRRKKRKPKFKLGKIIKIAEMNIISCKRDTTSWFDKMYTLRENTDDAMTSCHIKFYEKDIRNPC